jgi:hypothetical protein
VVIRTLAYLINNKTSESTIALDTPVTTTTSTTSHQHTRSTSTENVLVDGKWKQNQRKTNINVRNVLKQSVLPEFAT